MAERVMLPPKLDLSTIGAFHEQIEPLLGRDLLLDGTDLVHFGALGLQSLMAAAATLAQRGHTLCMVNISDRVLDQLSAMGMAPETLAGAVK